MYSISEALSRVSPETMQNIRKCYDLDKPGKMDEAVAILEDWIKKQNHFNKKDFSRNFLEVTIIQCKGSVERAKTRLDKYCTLRTMLPKFFDKFNAREFKDLLSEAEIIPLPKHTPDYNRVVMVTHLVKLNATPAIILEFFKLMVIMAEYQKAHDYFKGVIMIFDYRNVNIGELIAAVNPIELSQAMKIYTDCYGLRLSGFHFLTSSKMIQGLVTVLKQILSQKLGDRIHVHKNVDTLYEHVPREILPQEYGGDEFLISDIKAKWMDLLASEEHIKYMQEMRGATSDEQYRDTYEFNTKYMGLPGTFKTLIVD